MPSSSTTPAQARAICQRLLERVAGPKPDRLLKGVLKVGSRMQARPGGYLLARAGRETGATIFLRGAEPHADQLLV